MSFQPRSVFWPVLVALFLSLAVGFYLFSKPRRNFFPKKNEIAVVSNVEGFEVKLKDKKALRAYINRFGLFEKNGVRLLGTSDYQTIQGIIFHLAGSHQDRFFDEHLSKNGRVYGSIGAEVREDKLHLLVFLDPSLYYQKGQEGFSRAFSIFSIRGLFLSSRFAFGMSGEDRDLAKKSLSRRCYAL